MCPGNRIIFSCQQSAFTNWRVRLPGLTLQQNGVQNNPNGLVFTFELPPDPGFNFEIHIVSRASNGSHIIVITELQVNAMRELDGVTVECDGGSGSFMSAIQVASVGELIILHSLIPSLLLINLKTLQLL